MLLLCICSLRVGLNPARLRGKNRLLIHSGFDRCGSCLCFIRSLRSLVLMFL